MESGVLTVPAVKHAGTEAVAQLWANIYMSPDRQAPKSLAVTSPDRGQGTSSICTALAVMGAQAHPDQKTLLVDMNLRDPTLARWFSAQSLPGVTDLLAGREGLDQVVHPVPLEPGQLSLLPAGEGLDPIKLLAGQSVKKMIDQLTSRFDRIIFDLPAVNLYPETPVIAGLAGWAVMVVHGGATSRESASQARQRLETAGAKILGVVLNKRKFPLPQFLYNRV